jgi:hypothetical protein
VAARAVQYVDSARPTFHEMQRRDRRLRGVELARRVLHSGESCAGCEAEAGQGWQPIAEVAPIGSQECRGNCQCVIEYHARGREAA